MPCLDVTAVNLPDGDFVANTVVRTISPRGVMPEKFSVLSVSVTRIAETPVGELAEPRSPVI